MMTQESLRDNAVSIQSAVQDMVQASTESICTEISILKNNATISQEAMISLINDNNGFGQLRQAQSNHLVEASEQLISQHGQWLANRKKQTTSGAEPASIINDIEDDYDRRPSSENLTLLLQMQRQLEDLAQQVALLAESPSVTRDRPFPVTQDKVKETSELILYLARGIRQLLAYFWYALPICIMYGQQDVLLTD
jgi:hypothetical protein